MRIVITGAAGRIGREIVEDLSRSYNLCLIDRYPVPGYQSIITDLSQYQGKAKFYSSQEIASKLWAGAFDKAEIVIHLAEDPRAHASWVRVFNNNMVATWNVFQACAQYRVRRVVYASSNWVVKGLEQELAPACYEPEGPKIGSGANPRPVNPYGIGKAFGERIGRILVDDSRISSFVAIRIGSFTPNPPDDVDYRRHAIGGLDLRNLFRRCVEAEFEGSHIIYGVSAQKISPFDISYTTSLLCWEPKERNPWETRLAKNLMPELTVSMPAYNTGKYIGEAIKSVLRQDGVDFELFVVDDGSEDNTAEVAEAFNDPRIRLIRNEKNMGIGYCHNLVIEQSNSPFLAHVDSDDMVLPGAFQKMVEMLKSSPNIGQVHCNFVVIDEDGKTTRHFSNESDMDYKRELLIRGGVMNHLRIYRNEVFDTVGKFNQNLKYSVDCEMALRIVDKYDIKLVPEFLYCRRRHDSNTSQTLHFKELRFWYQRFFFSRELCKTGKVSFLKQKKYNLNILLILGLYNALRWTRQRTIDPIFHRVYKAIVKLSVSVFN